jgi:hypothetical protein
MRRKWGRLALLLAAGLGWTGCASTDKHLKPPKPPEEYNLPPEHDRRYSNPVEYPKDTLNKDVLLDRFNESKDGGPSGPAGVRAPRLGGGGPGGY